MKSWQIFHYAKQVLPEGTLARIYKRSARLLFYWCANPLHAESKKNPIDRITETLDELNLAGYGHVARAGIDIMAKPLGGRFAFFDDSESDKGTLDGEATDATIALGRLLEDCRKALEDGSVTEAELDRVEDQVRLCQEELKQIRAVVRQHRGPEDR